MKIRNKLCLILTLTLLTQGIAFAQEEETPWLTRPEPSAQHAPLAQEVGTWDTEMTLYFVDARAKPVVFKGTETNRLILDGLWLETRVDTEFPVKPYKGSGTTGFDAKTGKYVGTWVDNLSTHVGNYEGTYDEKEQTFTMYLTKREDHTGRIVRQKHVTRFLNDNTKHVTVYHPLPDGSGQFMKLLDVVSRRRAE